MQRTTVRSTVISRISLTATISRSDPSAAMLSDQHMHLITSLASVSPMPGMRSGPNVANSILVAAFRSALIHQGLVALLILASLGIVWASAREWLPGFARHGHQAWATARRGQPEPAGRSVLRIGFGLLWVLDGMLQAQPAMATGLPGHVIAPAAD